LYGSFFWNFRLRGYSGYLINTISGYPASNGSKLLGKGKIFLLKKMIESQDPHSPKKEFFKENHINSKSVRIKKPTNKRSRI